MPRGPQAVGRAAPRDAAPPRAGGAAERSGAGAAPRRGTRLRRLCGADRRRGDGPAHLTAVLSAPNSVMRVNGYPRQKFPTINDGGAPLCPCCSTAALRPSPTGGAPFVAARGPRSAAAPPCRQGAPRCAGGAPASVVVGGARR